MATMSDLYETELEVTDDGWMAPCSAYLCDGYMVSPTGSVIWLGADFDAARDDGVEARCDQCVGASKVIVASNRYPCVICMNTVKPAEGYRCDACGIPLCGGNACGGAHASHCKVYLTR